MRSTGRCMRSEVHPAPDRTHESRQAALMDRMALATYLFSPSKAHEPQYALLFINP